MGSPPRSPRGDSGGDLHRANNPALDINGDGRIDIADFGQFSVRYFSTLP